MAFRDAGGRRRRPRRLRAAVRVLVLAMDALVSRAGYPTPRSRATPSACARWVSGSRTSARSLLARACPTTPTPAAASPRGSRRSSAARRPPRSARTRRAQGSVRRVGEEPRPRPSPSSRRHRDAARAPGPRSTSPRRCSAARARLVGPRARARPEDGACATRRSPASRRPARSRSSWTATRRGSSPSSSLVKEKKLVGGGRLRLANRSLPEALARLGYSPTQAEAIVAHVERDGRRRGRAGPPRGAPAPSSTRPSRRAPAGASLSARGPPRDDGGRAAVRLGRDQQEARPTQPKHKNKKNTERN